MKKLIILLGLLGLILIGGLYAKGKFYDPRHQLENAKSEVKNLSRDKCTTVEQSSCRNPQNCPPAQNLLNSQNCLNSKV